MYGATTYESDNRIGKNRNAVVGDSDHMNLRCSCDFKQLGTMVFGTINQESRRVIPFTASCWRSFGLLTGGEGETGELVSPLLTVRWLYYSSDTSMLWGLPLFRSSQFTFLFHLSIGNPVTRTCFKKPSLEMGPCGFGFRFLKGMRCLVSPVAPQRGSRSPPLRLPVFRGAGIRKYWVRYFCLGDTKN